MTATFIDTHAHLDFPDFAQDLPETVARAQSAGIDRIITIGTTIEGSRSAVAIAEQFPNVFAAVGWHPSYVTSASADLPEEFRSLVRHPKVVALGECGLDYSRLPEDPHEAARCKERQKQLFQQQLELAAAEHLNVVIHQRDSFADTLAVLEPFASRVRGVFHCFVGTPAEAERVRALGSLISFTGIATFKNAATVRETLQHTRLGEFMLETDCPFLAPVPHRGKRCEPAYVADLAGFIAREKGCTLEELSRATNQTAEAFFPKLRSA